MEQPETATQQIQSPLKESQPEEVKAVKDKSPTTPTHPNNWWGGWISQAKEKVSFLKVLIQLIEMILYLFRIVFVSIFAIFF